jgi:hypothetical protein
MTLAPELESIQYMEYAVGGSYVVDRFLTVGARVKVLNGLLNISSDQARLDLTTDENYHINVAGEGLIRTSGVTQFEDLDLESTADVMALFGNSGLAIDLGATYKPMDRLTVGVSIIDLGSISWKRDLTNYVLNSSISNYTFRGFDIAEILNGNEESFGNSLDSLSNSIEFEEEEGERYSSFLPGKFFLSGSYKLNQTVTGNLLIMNEIYQKRWNTGISANIHKEFGRRMSMSLSYTAINRSANNLGMGLSFNLQPIQLYFVSDNMLSAPFSLLTSGELNPYLRSVKNVNLRFGLNFVFGWQLEESGISRDPQL